MKLIRFKHGDQAIYGIIERDTIYAVKGDIFTGVERGQAVADGGAKLAVLRPAALGDVEVGQDLDPGH